MKRESVLKNSEQLQLNPKLKIFLVFFFFCLVSSLARLTCQACYFSHSSFCNYTIAWAARNSVGSRQCPLQSTSSRISIKHGCINLLLQTKPSRGMTGFLKALNSFCVPSPKRSELLDQLHAAGTHNRVCIFPAIPRYQFLSPGQLGLGSGRPWCWKSSAFRYWAAKKTLSLNNLIGQLPEKLNQILFEFKLKVWLTSSAEILFSAQSPLQKPAQMAQWEHPLLQNSGPHNGFFLN